MYLDGHKTAISHTAINALFQEVGQTIELGGCASTEVACLTCCGQNVTNFVMEPITCPKLSMVCFVDVTEVMGQSQESARTLHGLLLVFGERRTGVQSSNIIGSLPIGLNPWLNEHL